MLENPTPAALPAHPDPNAVVKRYAPPNQRNRSLNRRKSGEKNQNLPPRNVSVPDHFDVGSSNVMSDNSRPRLVALDGCSRSQASQLLNDRWAHIMHLYNDASVDLSERPVMYSRSSTSAWGQFRLPHQFVQPENTVPAPGSQMDFLSELRRAMQNANSST